MTEEQLRKGGDIMSKISEVNSRIMVLQGLIDKGSLVMDVRNRGGVNHTLHVETPVIEALIRANIDEERQHLKELQEEFDNL